jgi:hypothetical protein
MPELYIITGSNGAGKSSIGPEYLPTRIREQGPIFDGDKLFVEKRNEYWKSGIKSHDRPVNLGVSSLKVLLDKGLKAPEFQTI